ncbi:MAG: DUF378 domain-containing protein [Candidatus Paceibacterota bacterium]
MSELNWLDWVVLILVIIGGINWGLYMFGYDLVAMLFGAMTMITKIIYGLVGIAAIYLAVISPKLAKK